MTTPTHYRALFALLVALALLQWLHGSVDLAFDRQRIDNGAVWRLVSGQLVHSSWIHFAMNALGLAVLWELMRQDFSVRAIAYLQGFLVVACGLLLYLFEPQLVHYVGLSGVLHGLLVAAAGRMISRGHAIGWLLAALVVAKLAAENVFPGSTAATAGVIGLRVATEVHLWGAMAGLVFAGGDFLWSSQRR